MKPGNIPTYIHTKSIHPPSVIKAVPEDINKRFISADQECFERAISVYQKHRHYVKADTPPSSHTHRQQTHIGTIGKGTGNGK